MCQLILFSLLVAVWVVNTEIANLKTQHNTTQQSILIALDAMIDSLRFIILEENINKVKNPLETKSITYFNSSAINNLVKIFLMLQRAVQ